MIPLPGFTLPQVSTRDLSWPTASFPTLRGLVRRRILVNFHVDPEVVQRHLPAPFRPKLVDGWAIAGVCLIRLEQLRPWNLPAALGIASENAAHRIAVTWHDDDGMEREGVYIPRRDTGLWLNAAVGGRVFPGEHHYARFRVREDMRGLDLKLESDDGTADVWLHARAATHLPSSSVFANLDEISAFFAGGTDGFSATRDAARLDGLRFCTQRWHVEPLDLDWLISSYYADCGRFPSGSLEYDSTLIMRNLPHEWRLTPAPSAGASTPAGSAAALAP